MRMKKIRDESDSSEFDIGGKGDWKNTSNERSNEDERKREKWKEKLDAVNRMLKGLGFQNDNDEKAPISKSDNLSSWRFDETTTSGPYYKQYDQRNTMTSSTEPMGLKKYNQYMENIERNSHYLEMSTTTFTPYSHYNTYSALPRRSHHHWHMSSSSSSSSSSPQTSHTKKIIGASVGALLMVLTCIVYCIKKCNKKPRGTVMYYTDPGAVQQQPQTYMWPPAQGDTVMYYNGVAPGAVQQQPQTYMGPPGQGDTAMYYNGVAPGAVQQQPQTYMGPPGQGDTAMYYNGVASGAVQQQPQTYMGPPGQGDTAMYYNGVTPGAVQQQPQTYMAPPGQGDTAMYYNGVAPGAVQQQPQIYMGPPGQGVPPHIEVPLPYPNCNNMNVNMEPPKDTEPLSQNNGLVEIGFRNPFDDPIDGTNGPSAPGDVKTELSDNGRTGDGPSLDVKDTGQGTRRAYGRDNVMHIDERGKYTTSFGRFSKK